MQHASPPGTLSHHRLGSSHPRVFDVRPHHILRVPLVRQTTRDGTGTRLRRTEAR